MIYAIPFVFSIATMCIHWKRRNAFVAFTALILLLAFICGFRGIDVGVDTRSFWESRDNVIYGIGYVQREFAYIFLTSFSQTIGANQQLIYVVYASLTMAAFGYFIFKFSRNIFLSLFMFIAMGTYYLSLFNQFRQGLAVALFGISLVFIEKTKPIAYVLSIAGIGLFAHTSAFILLPFYFLLRMEWSWKKKLCAVLLLLAGEHLLLQIVLATPYGYFVTRWEQKEMSNALIYLQMALSGIILCLESRLVRNNPKMKLFCNMNFFWLLVGISILAIPEIPREGTQRIGSYFLISNIILLPEILHLFRSSWRIVLPVILCFMSAYYVRNVYFMPYYKLTPYEFHFDVFEDYRIPQERK
jgi:hypothetical protein